MKHVLSSHRGVAYGKCTLEHYCEGSSYCETDDDDSAASHTYAISAFTAAMAVGTTMALV